MVESTAAAASQSNSGQATESESQQSPSQVPQQMLTAIEDIVQTNSESTWMTEIELEQATLRQNLLAKLAEVPPEATRVSGPREPNDVSYGIWERVKFKVGIDFEQPLLVS